MYDVSCIGPRHLGLTFGNRASLARRIGKLHLDSSLRLQGRGENCVSCAAHIKSSTVKPWKDGISQEDQGNTWCRIVLSDMEHIWGTMQHRYCTQLESILERMGFVWAVWATLTLYFYWYNLGEANAIARPLHALWNRNMMKHDFFKCHKWGNLIIP